MYTPSRTSRAAFKKESKGWHRLDHLAADCITGQMQPDGERFMVALHRARVPFKSDVIIIITLKRTMVLTVMRRRLSLYRVHLHVPRSVSDSLCYLESAWQGMHSSTAVSGGGVCWMIMPDNTSVNSRDDRPFCRVRCSCFCRAVSCHSCFLSIPARAMLSFLPCGVVPLVPVYDASCLPCRAPVCSGGGAGERYMLLGVAVGR